MNYTIDPDPVTCINQIEDDIAGHRRKINEELLAISAKSRIRNGLLPISKLLPELLAEIFIVFARNPMRWNPVTGPYSWIAVTHVCSYWREIALNTPRLWSYIFLGLPKTVNLFLERSRQAPLTILPWITTAHRHVPYGSGIFHNMTAVRQREIYETNPRRNHIVSSHWKRNSLTGSSNVFLAFLQRQASKHPILTTLKLKSRGESRRDGFPNILPRDYHLPKLTHVEIRGYPIPWEFLLLHTNLTSLVVHHSCFCSSSVFPSPPFCVKDLLVCLSQMPRLQSLDVNADRCSGQCESLTPPIGSMPIADLPCLKDVFMHVDAAAVEAFVTHANFPPSTRLSFETMMRHNLPHQAVDQGPCFSSIVLNSIGFPSRAKIDAGIPITGLSIIFRSLPPHYPDPDTGIGWEAPGSWVTDPLCQISIQTHQCEFLKEGTHAGSFSSRDPLPYHFSFGFSAVRSPHAAILLNKMLTQLPLSDLVYLNVSGTGCELGADWS
ncbi:hypothetical protein QCA50_006257 [Cerrena zonata]|uniref:F-box domain-containing protein n=1 Tax=Cerrena zonata TaxID=2478898 RepID=A0AAW0GHA1_9APHY